MEAQPNSMLDSSVSAAGHRRASDPNPFGRPSEAGVPCDEGAGPEDEEEWRSSTSPAISDDEEAMQWPQETPERDVITISDEEEDTGEERWSSPSPVVSDDEETMPWPPGTPEPEVIVISDEEEEEEQPDDGGEAPPTVTATYARAFADGRWRHQVTLVCVWEEEAGVPPTWQLEEEHPPAGPNPPQRQRSPTPPAVRSPPPPPPEWRPPFLRQTSCPEAGPRPTRPTLQRQSSAPEGEAGWQELPPPAWPPGITAMADAQPGPSRRASRIVWREGHRYRVKTSMRGTRVFRKV
ncbi:GH22553 [Drosophila grimshawi]|uniref:GH22553 n=1 Tax=Drosophila grimshawi TaxID=7222 RepID=B4K0N1_DROGR|nr:GH22553 [Drosophila grimshawi]